MSFITTVAQSGPLAPRPEAGPVSRGRRPLTSVRCPQPPPNSQSSPGPDAGSDPKELLLPGCPEWLNRWTKGIPGNTLSSHHADWLCGAYECCLRLDLLPGNRLQLESWQTVSRVAHSCFRSLPCPVHTTYPLCRAPAPRLKLVSCVHR